MTKNFLAYILFSIIIVIILVIGFEEIKIYFDANPYINGIILLTLLIGFFLYSFKIFSLSSEFRFMNSVAFGKLKLNDSSLNNYPITKSIANNLGITTVNKNILKTLDEILDDLLSSIESGSDISKYLINLAIFLGLIGTFYGLLLTIGSVSNVIDGLTIEQQDFGVFFNNLKDGLKSPLSGMTIAFSSSLFGLVTSLILGLYEVIIRGVKQSYYEFCENQIRLFYRSSPNVKKITQNSDNSSLAQNIASKLDDLVDGMKDSSKDLIRKEVITELKSVSKSIKDLDKK
tara:strand:- start:326 stop:1189 length:864 start_codon:yes stop_codon:yes gene_type:complete